MNLQKVIVLFMDYCMSKQLRPKTMQSYEQTLKLFARWLQEEMDIENVDEVKEPHIRSYLKGEHLYNAFASTRIAGGFQFHFA